MQAEVDRLSTNWRTLLDAMPEMVFLVREDGGVEYLNRSARACFGDPCPEHVADSLSTICRDCRDSLSPAATAPAVRETVLGSIPVEFSAVPFIGYTGERLIMLVMRDISQRKSYENELLQFNTSIENILSQKISELEASEVMRQKLSRQLNSLKMQLGHYHKADKMVGSSRRMRELREMIHQVAGSDATILITGESGTGKELVARALHDMGRRKDGKFVVINLAAVPRLLLEADLFGYEKGAFTGAQTQDRQVRGGRQRLSSSSTRSATSVRTCRCRCCAALQNGEIIRVGGNEPVQVDVRVIAATNVDWPRAVQDKKFGSTSTTGSTSSPSTSPLRERKEDIVELINHFVNHYRTAFGKEIDFVPKSVINRLLLHDWPGNVRELENLIQRACS